MTRKLFKDLTNSLFLFFKEHKITYTYNPEFDIDTLLEFLIVGDPDSEISHYIDNHEDMDSLNNELSGKCLMDIFPENLYKPLLAKENWDLSVMAINKNMDLPLPKKIAYINNLMPELTNIFTKYFPILPIPQDGYEILMTLFRNCLALLNDIPFKKQPALLPNRNSRTIIMPEKIEEFKKALASNQGLLLTGNAGSGKTIFIKYFLQYTDYLDAYYVSYSGSIENTLSRIRFANEKNYSLDETVKLLSEKKPFSLLVIDDLRLSGDALTKALAELSRSSL